MDKVLEKMGRCPRIAASAGFGLFFLFAFHRYWSGTISLRDNFNIFAPSRFQMARGLRDFTVYGWQPWQQLGLPYVADMQSAWFYPLNIIYLIFDFDAAYKLSALIHYPIAAIAMFGLMRTMKFGAAESVVAGLGLSVSGYMVGLHASPSLLVGLAWAPLALDLYLRSIDGGAAWSIASGLALGVIVLGGDPQGALIGALLMTVSCAYLLARGKRAALKRLLIAGACSILAAAVQVLPSIELLSMSERGGGVAANENTVFMFHPARLIEIVWANPFGFNGEELQYWARGFIRMKSNWFPWSPSNYLGMPLISLALVGLVAGRGRWRFPLAGLALLFLFLSMGGHTPVFGLFEKLPGFSLFRYPGKYMAWFTLCAALAAGLGFERVFGSLKERPGQVRRGAIAYLIATIAILGLSFIFWPKAIELYMEGPGNKEIASQARASIMAGGIRFAAVNILFALALLAAAARGVNNFGLKVFPVVLIGLDLATANISLMPAAPGNLYSRSSPIANAIRNRGDGLGDFRVHNEEIEISDYASVGEKVTPLSNQRINIRAIMYHDSAALENIEKLGGQNVAIPSRQRFMTWMETYPLALLQILNVKYFVCSFDKEMPSDLAEEIMKDRLKNYRLYKIHGSFPRAYWVPCARSAPTPETAYETFNRTDFRRRVILTEPEERPECDPGQHSLVPAEIVDYEPDRVELTIDAPADGWLVLSDRYYPGWVARVDGEPKPIREANVLVRAIEIDGGKHRVVFTFESFPLRLGMRISGIAWPAMVVAMCVLFYRGRKGRPAGGDIDRDAELNERGRDGADEAGPE